MVKRAAKVLISAAYLLGRYLYTLVCRLAGRGGPAPGCVVLYYHEVAPDERDRFARQMDVLTRWTRPISLDRPGNVGGSRRLSAISFDDAFRNVVDHALPELGKRQIPSTIFVPSGYLGRRAGWSGNPMDMHAVISADTLQSLPSELVSIGSHTVTHPHLTRLPREAAREEIVGSKTQLETILGRPVTLLAFPYGDHDEEIVRFCRDAGYERVFTVEPSHAFRTPDEYRNGRVPVSPGDWGLEFRLKLLGAYEWVPFAGKWKRRILSRLPWSR